MPESSDSFLWKAHSLYFVCHHTILPHFILEHRTKSSNKSMRVTSWMNHFVRRRSPSSPNNIHPAFVTYFVLHPFFLSALESRRHTRFVHVKADPNPGGTREAGEREGQNVFKELCMTEKNKINKKSTKASYKKDCNSRSSGKKIEIHLFYFIFLTFSSLVCFNQIKI